jgi:hypothetical protein
MTDWVGVVIMGVLIISWVYQLISGRAVVYGNWKARRENPVGYWITVVVWGIFIAIFWFALAKAK